MFTWFGFPVRLKARSLCGEWASELEDEEEPRFVNRFRPDSSKSRTKPGNIWQGEFLVFL